MNISVNELLNNTNPPEITISNGGAETIRIYTNPSNTNLRIRFTESNRDIGDGRTFRSLIVEVDDGSGYQIVQTKLFNHYGESRTYHYENGKYSGVEYQDTNGNTTTSGTFFEDRGSVRYDGTNALEEARNIFKNGLETESSDANNNTTVTTYTHSSNPDAVVLVEETTSEHGTQRVIKISDGVEPFRIVQQEFTGYESSEVNRIITYGDDGAVEDVVYLGNDTTHANLFIAENRATSNTAEQPAQEEEATPINEYTVDSGDVTYSNALKIIRSDTDGAEDISGTINPEYDEVLKYEYDLNPDDGVDETTTVLRTRDYDENGKITYESIDVVVSDNGTTKTVSEKIFEETSPGSNHYRLDQQSVSEYDTEWDQKETTYKTNPFSVETQYFNNEGTEIAATEFNSEADII